MKFEENVRELRKQRGMSQEELAEYLKVSRQSISKYENGTASPELDKLMQLCELFDCTLDDLLKGEVKERDVVSKEVYERHENQQSKMMSLGVVIILAGLSCYSFMEDLFTGKNSYVLDVMFLFFVAIAVLIFVYYGMSNSNFQRKYKQLPMNIYSEAEKDAFHKKYQIAIVIGIAFLMAGLFSNMMMEEMVSDSFANGFFMLMVTIAVGIFVYYGMLKSKFDKTEVEEEGTAAFEKKKAEMKIGKWCACIMMMALAIFLLWSFLLDAWRVSWLIFPIGGILCGIVAMVYTNNDE